MVEVKNLSKIFANGAGASDISFSIFPGDIIGLVGDNGAGKSTIIKTMFNEYKKTSGEVLFEGEPLKRKMYKKMAFFPDQSIYPKDISIEKYCIYSGCLSDLSRKESKKRTDQLLTYLKLQEYKKKTFKELSAGMQKRAMLAITMVSNPEIIIFDEPTANLDVTTRFEFMDLLRKLAKGNKSIMITSHIINELQGLVNRLIIIKEGRMVYNQPLAVGEQIIDIYNACTKSNQPHEEFDAFSNIFR